ncbi:hypothetical protein HHK36_007044 [Tetracentron sinense]|uniref:DNA-3-methyladenine glycosylase I n=1 Tax=Tetracentron sinense TaxID=13715 RepID=A0A834ZJ35_TETSI|nr:hypothetical protein HHK36_007044 [Tetracentron sinense]
MRVSKGAFAPRTTSMEVGENHLKAVTKKKTHLKWSTSHLKWINFVTKHPQNVFLLDTKELLKSSSSLSLSSSQNSNDSPLKVSVTRMEQKISATLRRVTSPERREVSLSNVEQDSLDSGGGSLKRCNWITKSSDQDYVLFHDERWGIPVYDDNQLFELLTLSGMLMDRSWTEILKRKELFREAFSGFDPNIVVKMGKKEITDIGSNKALMLAGGRIVKEFGSFSSYLWGYMNYKPMINMYKYPINVPLRTPKSEAISKDLVRRGFRLVGPVIVHSFMQAAGMTMDHLVDCFRFNECVKLAERQWRHG